MQASDIALIQRFYDQMWHSFDKTIIPELLTEDVTFRGSLGQERRGHAGFAEYVDFVRAAFPDFHNTIEEMFGEGDRAFARLRYSGTHRGEIFGISPTGVRVEYSGAARFWFRADRICGLWVLGDVYGLVQQLSAPGLPQSIPDGPHSRASHGSPVRLRPTTEEDIDFILSAERDSDNAPFIIIWTRAQHLQALSDPNFRHLVIEPSGEHRRVGFILLAGVTNPHGSVELRRIVVTEKGHGFGKAAVRAVKQLAFKKLNAHRLWLDVKEHNMPARRLYESEGFVSDGFLRECLRSERGFDSLVVMSMLASEAFAND